MKTTRMLGLVSFLIIALLLLFAIHNFNLTADASQSGTAVSMQQTATPASPLGTTSEIGSTNGIFVMGIIITLIVTLPILLHKRKLP
ncbi:MAG TPA: hypothetical protein PK078_05350 [Anaerolineales bacterium]|nr:hypothetical protein [Anaerolineales bacterium]HNA89259.1 hypothetical protein [Anaerolineales bacterium]HNB35720.1 hypothetical protein [Anaerolineales bacterium]HNC07204.1 hypothetical protein [Anaerolineales bacterium]